MDIASENSSDRSRRIIVGLGNPGRKYVETRHNVGFRVLETLRQRWALDQGSEKFHSLIWKTTRGGFDEEPADVVLVAPMTYMNESGKAVRAVMDFFKTDPHNILVVYDDFALPAGQLRIRAKGSAGGHNGLTDIILRCGTNEVPRLRVGIGECPGVMDPRDFVLSKFRKDEIEIVEVAIQNAADAAEKWLAGNIHDVMQIYNRKNDDNC